MTFFLKGLNFFHYFDLCGCFGSLAILYSSTFFIVDNQLDSEIMARLAMGGLLNGI